MEPRRNSGRSFRAERELLGVGFRAAACKRMYRVHTEQRRGNMRLRTGSGYVESCHARRKTSETDRRQRRSEADNGERKDGWTGCHMSEMKLEGLEEVPEIAYKLGIAPRNWKTRKDGIWTDSEIEEAVPLRGSSFSLASYGGAAALYLYSPRSSSSNAISFRSALWLDDWELITEILERNA